MFKVEKVNGTCSVIKLKEPTRITGEISIGFREWLLKQKFEQSKAVIFDANNLIFIDSMGIASFIALYKKLSQSRIPIVLCGLSPDLKNLFMMLKLNTLFDIDCDSVSMALERFGR